MITLTEKAIAKIKEIGLDEELKLLIRVKTIGGGCNGFENDMYFDELEPTDFDEVYEFDGIKIICDQLSLQYMDGTEIDWEDGEFNQGFRFKNPNISSQCGCGKSFSIT